MATKDRESEIDKVKRQGKRRGNMRELGDLPGDALGLHWPRQKPNVSRLITVPETSPRAGLELGAPLNIQQVAALIGCSPWSIRQTWIRKGLPHVRAKASGKFIFFEKEVTLWLRKQQGGQRL